MITQRGSPPLLYDAHACGKEDVALQATRTRRSGSLCEPCIARNILRDGLEGA